MVALAPMNWPGAGAPGIEAPIWASNDAFGLRGERRGIVDAMASEAILEVLRAKVGAFSGGSENDSWVGGAEAGTSL